MASSIKTIEVSNVGSTIQILVANIVKPNAPECFALTGVKSVVPIYNLGIGRAGIINPTTYPFTDQLVITVNFNNEHANPPITFDIQTVSNQAGWTADLPGLIQAVTDICGWISAAGGSTGLLATEVTLLATNALLATIDADTSNLDVALSTRATEATLVALLAKVIAAPSTEAKQDAAIVLLTTIAGLDFATETTLASILSKLTGSNLPLGAVRYTDGVNHNTTAGKNTVMITCETGVETIAGVVRPIGIYTYQPTGDDKNAIIVVNANSGALIVDEL